MRGQHTKGGRGNSEGGRHAVSSSLPPPEFRIPISGGFLLAAAFAVGLCWIFWAPLWEGGSLIGGDLFSYFFPQKVFFAEQLDKGVIPLWNPLTGHGYPTIAESQTGVCYPPDLLAYRLLPVTMAYNVVQIVHYVFAFLGMWLLAKRSGCRVSGAILAALSFVYGWFPPRICLEWAIVTGAYVPWAIWCAESFLQLRQRRYLVGLCLLLALQLFAGHFHLAFLTQLTLVIYAPLRWRMLNCSVQKPVEAAGQIPAQQPRHQLAWLLIWGAIAVSFLLAAVQLAPTWELKQRSQRSDVSGEHQPGYGHLPPRYWSQVIVPWLWYGQDIDKQLETLPNYAGGAGTNKVEAHLYFGILPLIFALGELCVAWRRRTEQDRIVWLWAGIGMLFLFYTPGWLLPVTQHLPGFSFFRGPGRYGIMTSLAVAMLAGIAFDQLVARFAVRWRLLLAAVVLGVTVAELWWVAQAVRYSELLSNPIVEQRFSSPLRRIFAQESQPARLYAPMANVANLLDVSALPVYLGIGPQEYFDSQFTMPAEPNKGLDPAGRADQIAWLQQAGVTHILSLEKLSMKVWPVDFLGSDFDPLFNRALGRPREPVYLYRLRHTRGRIAWEDPSAARDAEVEITDYAPHRVAARCTSNQGGRVILTDLAYPGWQVDVDGKAVSSESSGMFRAVTVAPGPHKIVWTYHPRSVYWGAIISGVTFLLLIVGGFLSPRRGRIVEH